MFVFTYDVGTDRGTHIARSFIHFHIYQKPLTEMLRSDNINKFYFFFLQRCFSESGKLYDTKWYTLNNAHCTMLLVDMYGVYVWREKTDKLR